MRRIAGTPRRRHHILGLGLALAAGLSLVAPSPRADDAAEPNPTRSLTVLAEPTSAERLAEPTSLHLTVDGAPHPILGVEPVDHWEIVVAIDPALSRRASGEAMASLLRPHLDRLAEIGDLRVLLIDNWVDEIVTPSDSSAGAIAALERISGLGTFGQLESLRAEAEGDQPTEERHELAREDLRLVRWQREALLDWALAQDAAEPKALFLLADAYDGRIGAAYGIDDPELDSRGNPALDDEVLGATLAAGGWTVFALRPAATAAAGAAPSALCEASGGHVIRDAEELSRALDLLDGAHRIDLALDRPPSFPLPVELAVATELAPGSGISSPRWISAGLLPGLGAARARRLLTLDETGALDVRAALHEDGPDAASLIVEIGVALDAANGTAPSSAWLSPALYIERLDAVPLEIELTGRGESLAGVDTWVSQLALPLPTDAVELVAVVSDTSSGRWGASRLESGDGRLARSGPGRVVEPFDLRPARSREEDHPVTEADTTIALLAPRGQRLTGRQRFRTLVTTTSIRRAEFYLDGEVVATDDEAPFDARIDLGPEARHTVEVRAYDAVGDLVGSDSIRLNEPFRSLDVSITDLTVGSGSSEIRLSAAVDHPTDIAVERVEYYHNETLLGSADAPPWSFEGPVGAIGETDYVRVVAYFDDGRFLEDVRLLSSPGSIEQVEVNLVQVYVVATDADGEPVADLTRDDFRIRLKGEPQEIQRFAYADEVPLELALVIDTSPSMWPLMPDTRRAAARFLTQMVGEKDRALVIDFDTRPRVAHPLSADLGDLLVSLGGLEAEEQGTTALYDSVIFAALELPRGQQRKAVVLLTDGDDYRSRFSLGRAIDTAKQTGVPVYVVSLAGIQDPRRQFRRTDLDALTGETGGEAYYLAALSTLGSTYDGIARELRSQYLLAFPTTEQLSEKDLESLRVTVERPGLELRTVVGGRSVN